MKEKPMAISVVRSDGRPRERNDGRDAPAVHTGPTSLGVYVGRVGGVEVRLDWSLIVVFFLITVNLGMGLFPLRHPEWHPALVWGLALLAAVLFFASVLAHELAHALVGRRFGVRMEGITLFLFGGMARMGDEPPTPKAEAIMAIVGPLTSLVIGGLALTLGLATVRAPSSGDVALAWTQLGPLPTLLLWLGPINIFLGVFNLVPAYPLDGGRVLRAILWRTTGDLEKATLWASYVGRAFALLLIFAGVLMLFGRFIPLLGAGPLSGLWLVFLGWFLNHAAIQSYEQVRIRKIFHGLPVARLMRAMGPAVPAASSVERVAERFLDDPSQRCLPVVEGGDFLGLICMSDLKKVSREQWRTRTVEEIMTPASRLAVATPSDDLSEALRKLATQDVDQLPVVERGAVQGVLRRSDVLRWMELQSARA
jgi:Zn-dependent protease